MKKINLAFFLLTLIVFSCAKAVKPKHIVIDHNDFLIEPDTSAALAQIGWMNLGAALIGSMLGGVGIQNMLPEFFKILATLNNETSPIPIVWQNHKAPYVFYESLTDKLPAQAILTLVQEGIKKKQLSNESLMLKFAEITFDPEINTKVMKTITEAINLLKELRAHGHTLHILGNWNKEAAEKLKAKHREAFELFNGKTIFSGDIGIVKSPAMYKKFFEITSLCPDDTIFIETQASNLQHFFKLDTSLPQLPHCILCENKDFTSTRQRLVKLGVLSKK